MVSANYSILGWPWNWLISWPVAEFQTKSPDLSADAMRVESGLQDTAGCNAGAGMPYKRARDRKGPRRGNQCARSVRLQTSVALIRRRLCNKPPRTGPAGESVMMNRLPAHQETQKGGSSEIVRGLNRKPSVKQYHT